MTGTAEPAAQRTRTRTLLGIIRGAPLMVTVVYGVPLLLLGVGLVSVLLLALPAAASLVLRFDIATWRAGWVGAAAGTWGLAALVLVIPAYWLLAFLAGLALRARGPQVGRRLHGVTGRLPARGEDALHSGTPSEDAVLAIPAPGVRTDQPPLTSWSPLAGDGTATRATWAGTFEFRRIGIVLSGGGAKGIYQAAAMKAIYEFLAERNALDCVVSIAGTSIGSWNGLFWLAGLTSARESNGISAQQRWWTTVRLSNIIEPSTRVLVPGLWRYLVSADPWRREFRAWFGDDAEAGVRERLQSVLNGGGLPHFYFTRTNVLEARLAYDTNNPAAVRTEGITHDTERGRRVRTVQELETGIFLSMGIPPLLPYGALASGPAIYEDGGVIDNLPARLATAFDQCDLLFVLPLNATFAEARLPQWLPARLYRVLDVRGGILERAALKNIYLFNERYAASGERNPVPAFVIAPDHPAVDTFEFWELGRWGPSAFEVMYQATREALRRFFQPQRMWDFFAAFEQYRQTGKLPAGGYVRMALVPPSWTPGTTLSYEDRF